MKFNLAKAMKIKAAKILVLTIFFFCSAFLLGEGMGGSEAASDYKELEVFLDEFVWVAIDNSKIKLGEKEVFTPYSVDLDKYYRGYLRVVGKKGIFLERGITTSERGIRNKIRAEETWIPFEAIIAVSKREPERD